tara:strand:+ start:1709 stop:1900 length:192 start_codon:yes stop_codon:yes gene_type:complete
MKPEEDIEVITNFVIRNQLMETVEEVKQLEHLLKEAKERLKVVMERRGLLTWNRWLWSWLGYY